jgi:hypothetical protein
VGAVDLCSLCLVSGGICLANVLVGPPVTNDRAVRLRPLALRGALINLLG